MAINVANMTLTQAAFNGPSLTLNIIDGYLNRL